MAMYLLKDVLRCLKENNLFLETNIDENSFDKKIESIEDNSQNVVKNTLFFCKGAGFKKDYLKDAIIRGSLAYITDNRKLLTENNFILVTDIRKSMGVIASKYYDDAWKKMKLIGITGTKGKSTTAYMIKSIIDDFLKNENKYCGIMSSIENFDGESFQESHLTTQEPIALHRMFSRMVKNNCNYCVMEVSSQALKYDRVWGIEFEIGAFLNIGEDHISDIEHNSFEDYYNAKLKIFEYCKEVVLDKNLRIEKDNAIYYSKKLSREKNHYMISNISFDGKKQNFEVSGIGKLSISILGDFNIKNGVASAIICHEIGIPFENIRSGLEKARADGRMEFFYSTKSENIAVVDYAHNKLSYESLFSAIKKDYGDYKIVTIFGCPGKKALKRRMELPQVAEKFSDYIYITEEDYGEENLDEISAEIYSNIIDKNVAEIENNRELAIKKSFTKFSEKTMVLILGKGRETRQKRGKVYVDTVSDVDLAQKYINL